MLTKRPLPHTVQLLLTYLTVPSSVVKMVEPLFVYSQSVGHCCACIAQDLLSHVASLLLLLLVISNMQSFCCCCQGE